MFFSTELLSRRDNGFGLLWLAATLGAKSSFKKLPKRSVLTADISELCGLIAEPAEPLALRLSSNLMVGVVRVYKVKQEILLTDVTTCFNTLKKAIQEIHSLSAEQLQMGQPTVRVDTVTIGRTDPVVAFAMKFDHLLADWDENSKESPEPEDDEYNPANKNQRKTKARQRSLSIGEQGRANLHTLNEDHDLLLSGSLEISFDGDGIAGFVPSSSQAGFHDNYLEGLDLGDGLGEELARELGDGWGISTQQGELEAANDALDTGMPFDIGHMAPVDENLPEAFEEGSHQASGTDGISKSAATETPPPNSQIGTTADIPEIKGGDEAATGKKRKRTVLLLDARTELTNEELEKARAHYIEGQAELRREIAQKKTDRESAKMLEELIWGAPRGINAPALVRFWLDNFKLQDEARSGKYFDDQQVPKRQRVHTHESPLDDRDTYQIEREPMDLDGQPDWIASQGFAAVEDPGQEYAAIDVQSRLRSSEEPGQARRDSSRPPSIVGSYFGLGTQVTQDLRSDSQRSNLFPWDNAGASSSVSAVFIGGGSDRVSFVQADTRVRSNSAARESLGIPASPASFGLKDLHHGSDGFEFMVPGEENGAIVLEPEDSNLATLERNSYNFLEYAKMQMNAFPSNSLTFNDVVPPNTSTRHVAAAAFYHCLVLATKDLLQVQQNSAYEAMRLTLK